LSAAVVAFQDGLRATGSEFRLEVPPGRYDVAIDDRFVQYDINELTHGTTKLSLVAGQCGQFQFVPH